MEVVRLLGLYVGYKDGSCIYNRHPKGLYLDPSMITGFLSAISHFVQEAALSKDPLKEMSAGETKFVYEWGKDIFIAALCYRTADSTKVRRMLEKIIIDLENDLKEVLPKWNGKLRDLAAPISKIVERNVTSVSTKLPFHPAEDELLRHPEDYYFELISTNLDEIRNILLRDSNLYELIKMKGIDDETLGTLLEILDKEFPSLEEISNFLTIEPGDLVPILIHLDNRGIVSCYKLLEEIRTE